MLYIGSTQIDTTDKSIIQFAQRANIGDAWNRENVIPDEFCRSSAKNIEVGAPQNTIKMYWTVIDTFDLLKTVHGNANQRICELTCRVICSRNIAISASISLLLKKSLDSVQIQAIEKAFSSYKFPESGDVDLFIEKQLVKEPQIKESMFGLELQLAAIIMDETSENSAAENLLRAWINKNYPDDNEYKLRRKGRVELDRFEEAVKHKNQTEGNDPNAAAENAAKQDAEESHCSDKLFKTITWDLATLPSAPSVKMEWGWHRVKQGCVNLDLYYPEEKTRDNELVAVTYINIPKGWEVAETAINECARTSANSPPVIIAIFTDFSHALYAFKDAFISCLDETFKQNIACIEAGIIVNTRPVGDWH